MISLAAAQADNGPSEGTVGLLITAILGVAGAFGYLYDRRRVRTESQQDSLAELGAGTLAGGWVALNAATSEMLEAERERRREDLQELRAEFERRTAESEAHCAKKLDESEARCHHLLERQRIAHNGQQARLQAQIDELRAAVNHIDHNEENP